MKNLSLASNSFLLLLGDLLTVRQQFPVTISQMHQLVRCDLAAVAFFHTLLHKYSGPLVHPRSSNTGGYEYEDPMVGGLVTNSDPAVEVKTK